MMVKRRWKEASSASPMGQRQNGPHLIVVVVTFTQKRKPASIKRGKSPTIKWAQVYISVCWHNPSLPPPPLLFPPRPNTIGFFSNCARVHLSSVFFLSSFLFRLLFFHFNFSSVKKKSLPFNAYFFLSQTCPTVLVSTLADWLPTSGKLSMAVYYLLNGCWPPPPPPLLLF